jgi:hypothetical protein
VSDERSNVNAESSARSGEAHTYEFSIRGAAGRGIYCTYCADATTLAFVDGTVGPDGMATCRKTCGSAARQSRAR